MGALLAYSLKNGKIPNRSSTLNLKTTLFLASLGLILYIIWASQLSTKRNFANDVLERTVFSVFSLVLIAQAVKGFKSIIQLILENKIIVYLGKISYGIYVYHNFVYNYYHSSKSDYISRILLKIEKIIPFFSNNLLFELLYYFVWTVIIASLSWFLIEKPINKLKDQFSYS
jgi:peptidoglycan/LPS O-acetylase OafA/YrhL